MTGGGSIVIEANQAGDSNYNAAVPVFQNLTVNPAAQTISFGSLSAVTYGVSPINLSSLGASASSGLPITYTVDSGPGFTSGNLLTVTGAGTIVVEADQAGNANYGEATPVTRSMTVNAASLTVTASSEGKTYGQVDPTLAFTYVGLVNGDTAANFTGALSRAAGENANTYTISRNTLAATGNYTIGSFNNGTFTISAATPTVHAASESIAYSGTEQAYPLTPSDVSVSGVSGSGDLVPSGSFSYSYFSAASPAFGPSTTPPTSLGTYTVTVTFTSTDANYTGATGTTTFSIVTLAAPTPLSPVGTVSPSTGYDTPTFTWSPVTGVDHYYLQVMDDTAGTTVINIPNVGSANTYTATQALTPGHTFTWYVFAASLNSQSYAYLQTGATFTLAPLGAPALISPTSTISPSSGYDTPTFSSGASPGANHYYLAVIDNNTNAPVVNVPNAGTGTTYTLNTSQALTPGHSFTWYVYAMSTNGQEFGYVMGGQTFTLSPLAAPALIGPTGVIAASSGFDRPTFTWGALTGANHYYLYVVDDNTNTAAINIANAGSGTAFTPNTSQALTPGHHFTWYVFAFSTNGLADSYLMAGQTFTLAALAAPTPLGPTGNIVSTTPTFSWTTVTGADHYAIYVYDDTAGTAAINNPDVGGNSTTSFTPSSPLTVGHQYTWYVFATSTNDQDNGYLMAGETFKIT